MRRQVTTIQAHSLDDVELVVQAAALLHGNDPFASDLVHGVGDQLGDGLFVGGQRGDARDLLAALDGGRLVADLVAYGGHGAVDTGFQGQRIGAGGDVLEAALDDGTGEHDGSGGAVTDNVVGLGGCFLHHLGAHIFIGVGQFDFLGDSDAVAAHHGQGPNAPQDNVAAAGAQGQGDRSPELVNAVHQASSSVVIENQLLFGHGWDPPFMRVLWLQT